MAKTKQPVDSFDFLYTPLSESQKQAGELWRQSRILFFIGEAGTGKSCCALGLAVRDALKTVNKEKQNKQRIWLCRPTVECGEELGLLPGTIEEKLGPWLSPFYDCFGDLSNSKWDRLEELIEIEAIPVGMMRGRTIRNGSLIVDEAQNLTYSQVKTILTRLGRDSKIIFCLDPNQSDLFQPNQCPAVDIARRISCLDAVGVLWFNPYDQLRDPVITDILKLV